MSHYNEDANSCRVDFFKPSGKWYATMAVRFDSKDFHDTLIHDALLNALRKANAPCKGMQAVCLEPFHKNSHPISLIWEG